MAVRAPADKRFKRARVRAPRRRRNWRRWIVPVVRAAALLAATAYVTNRAVALVTRTPALRIRHVAVQGTRHLTPADVTASAEGPHRPEHPARRPRRLAQRLLEDPWIRQAALRRALPAIVVSLVEREPIGIGRSGDRFFLVAADGMMLATGAAIARYDLPLVDGLHNGPIVSAPYVDADRAALAASVVRNVRQSRISTAASRRSTSSNEDDAVVLLADEATRLHLGRERFAERLRAYLDLGPSLRARVPSIDYVDSALRLPRVRQTVAGR